MKFLLIALYWFEGFLLAIAACCALGFLLCALLALFRVPKRGRNAGLFVGYAVCGALCLLFIWGGFSFACWLGDRTSYVGQKALLIGACFPGVFSLTVIPQFIAVARRQTLGIEVE